MDVKSVLNRVEKHKGFVYGKAKWGDDGNALVIPVEPRKGSQPRCSICGLKGATYDRLPERRFQFVPLWGMAVFLLYAMRRVECPVHGVKVEAVPWAVGKKRLTRSFCLFLAHWARRLSWKETAEVFGTSWRRVYEAVRWVVEFGLEHRNLTGVEAIGVDEIHWGKGQRYLTLVNTKYCFLKNPQNLTPSQKLRLKDVLKYDLKSVRAYLLKESFQLFWTYWSPHWARWFLRKWCTRAMRSRLDPIKKFVGTLRRHEDLILNWFKARKTYSSGVVEGLNRKVNLITRKAFGFRSLQALQTALYHTLGCLPEPAVTHKFW
jgi:transposase